MIRRPLLGDKVNRQPYSWRSEFSSCRKAVVTLTALEQLPVRSDSRKTRILWQIISMPMLREGAHKAADIPVNDRESLLFCTDDEMTKLRSSVRCDGMLRKPEVSALRNVVKILDSISHQGILFRDAYLSNLREVFSVDYKWMPFSLEPILKPKKSPRHCVNLRKLLHIVRYGARRHVQRKINSPAYSTPRIRRTNDIADGCLRSGSDLVERTQQNAPIARANVMLPACCMLERSIVPKPRDTRMKPQCQIRGGRGRDQAVTAQVGGLVRAS